MDYDGHGLGQLLEQSDDIHADAMRASRAQLGEIVEIVDKDFAKVENVPGVAELAFASLAGAAPASTAHRLDVAKS
ncbi:MAG: hypothetical protein ACYCXY_05150 [Acidimicrobiales bacterium]